MSKQDKENIFYLFFKQLSEKNQKVVVELKNDVKISGNLANIDENMNLQIANMNVITSDENP